MRGKKSAEISRERYVPIRLGCALSVREGGGEEEGGGALRVHRMHGREESGIGARGEWRMYSSANFERLVLCCIDADFCNRHLHIQYFSRSTRLSIQPRTSPPKLDT